MKYITVIGSGPGCEDYLLPAAVKTAQNCDRVVADKGLVAVLEKAEVTSVETMESVVQTLSDMEAMEEESRMALFVSGDPAYYSMYRMVKRVYPDMCVDYIPGISSLQMMAARAGVTMEDAAILSGHGRALSISELYFDVRKREAVFVLCDGLCTPSWIGEKLVEGGVTDVRMWAGSRLTYEDEICDQGSPESFIGKNYPALTVVCIKNEHRNKKEETVLVRDEQFCRNATPMTREEIRWSVIGKLELKPSSVLWDIGAGTGSISIEAARLCPKGQVISFERNPRALEILEENKERFEADNMRIISGDALEVLMDQDPKQTDAIPKPTHVFLGGTGGDLEALLDRIVAYGPWIQVMISCVTLETTAKAVQSFCRGDRFCDVDIVTIQTEHGRTVGDYHLMEADHRVTLISGKVNDTRILWPETLKYIDTEGQDKET